MVRIEKDNYIKLHLLNKYVSYPDHRTIAIKKCKILIFLQDFLIEFKYH